HAVATRLLARPPQRVRLTATAEPRRVEGDLQMVVRIEWIGIRQGFVQVRNTVAIGVGGRGESRQRVRVTQLPGVRYAVTVRVPARLQEIGPDVSDGVAQADPAAIGAPNGPAEPARLQIH